MARKPKEVTETQPVAPTENQPVHADASNQPTVTPGTYEVNGFVVIRN